MVHLSDLHLRSLDRIHDALWATIRKIEPNLIVLTGDCIESPSAMSVLQDFCRALVASDRDILATLGNWEHWGHVDVDFLRRAYARVGVRLLGNESIVLHRAMTIVATDDSCSAHDDARAALRDAPSNPVRLFLTHAPGIFDKLPPDAPKFDLGLAGHTHGGQVRPLGFPIRLPPESGRFIAGDYITPKGPIYVSRGIGTSILPARFLCRPELAVFRWVNA